MPVIPYYRKTVDPTTQEEIWVSDTNLPLPSEVRRRWCFGLPLSKSDGEPMSDDDLIDFLMAAIATTERELGVYLKPTIIKCNAEARGLVRGVDYEKEENPYDYNAKAWMNYGFLQLKKRPVIEVNEFLLVLPNGNIIMDFMTRPDWLKLYKDNGQVQIVPYAGDPTMFALLGGTVSGFPFVTGAISSNLPQMIHVDYVSGFHLNEIPGDIRNVIARQAAITVLGIAGDAVLAGVASMSTSIDGLSESFSTTASATSATYGAHIKQLQDEVDDFFKKGGARSSVLGIMMTGL